MKVTVDWTKVAATFLRFTAPAFAVASLITTALVALSPVPDWAFYAKLIGMKAAVWAGLGVATVIGVAVWSFVGAYVRTISSTVQTYRSPASAVANAGAEHLRLR